MNRVLRVWGAIAVAATLMGALGAQAATPAQPSPASAACLACHDGKAQKIERPALSGGKPQALHGVAAWCDEARAEHDFVPNGEPYRAAP